MEKAKLKYELERERSRLSKDMLEATNEYSNKMIAMEKLHMNEKEHLRAQSEQEKNVSFKKSVPFVLIPLFNRLNHNHSIFILS